MKLIKEVQLLNTMSDQISDFIAKVSQQSIKIERNLGNILANHYTKGNFFVDFTTTIIPEFTFDKKIKLVEIIIKNNYPEHYKKYKKVFDSVDIFRQVRNGLIHGHFPSSLQREDRIIYAIKRNGKISWGELPITKIEKFLKNAEKIEKNIWNLDTLVFDNPQCREPDKTQEKTTIIDLD